LVGAIALAVAGKWQQGAVEGARGLQLATLTALSGGYVLANVGGITLTEVGAWRAMYFVGLVVGAALFVSAARALLKDQRSTQKA
jgi:MFS family permease